MVNKNEIKKDLYKSKINATFDHYVAGNLYYNVLLFGNELYQFPIPVVEWENKEIKIDLEEKDGSYALTKLNTMNLSSYLGTTSFYGGMKASELNRWIDKAIDNGEFIKIG